MKKFANELKKFKHTSCHEIENIETKNDLNI